MALMDGKFSLSSLKSMLNPGTVSGLTALLIIICGIQLPDFIKTAITYLGNVTSPMALVAVGFTLAHSDLKKIFCQPRLYVFSAIKLLALPLALLPLLKLVTGDYYTMRIYHSGTAGGGGISLRRKAYLYRSLSGLPAFMSVFLKEVLK